MVVHAHDILDGKGHVDLWIWIFNFFSRTKNLIRGSEQREYWWCKTIKYKNIKGGKDSLKKEANGETYASEQTLEPIESVVQVVSSQEYASVTIEIGEHIQIEEHKT